MNTHRNQCFIQTLDTEDLAKLEGDATLIIWDAETVCVHAYFLFCNFCVHAFYKKIGFLTLHLITDDDENQHKCNEMWALRMCSECAEIGKVDDENCQKCNGTASMELTPRWSSVNGYSSTRPY